MHGTNRPPFTAAARNQQQQIAADRPFGLPADSVERRDTLGRRIRQAPEFTLEQMERIKQYYTYTPAWRFDLAELAKKIGERMSALVALRPASQNYSNRKGGHREDLNGQYFRSSWEANYARYLNFLTKLGAVERWEYEPDTFWFKDIKRGVTNYKPDFRVKFKGDDKLVYIEVKGQIVPKDKVKWRRMKKYYPQIILQIVASKEYYDIQKKWSSAIPTWEKKPPYVRSARR
jgi:hypothetical protein